VFSKITGQPLFSSAVLTGQNRPMPLRSQCVITSFGHSSMNLIRLQKNFLTFQFKIIKVVCCHLNNSLIQIKYPILAKRRWKIDAESVVWWFKGYNPKMNLKKRYTFPFRPLPISSTARRSNRALCSGRDVLLRGRQQAAEKSVVYQSCVDSLEMVSPVIVSLCYPLCSVSGWIE